MSETASKGSAVVRVLLVDDHTILREGVRSLLADEPDLRVIGEARDGVEAVEQVGRLEPDVVVMYMGNIVEGGTVEEVLRTPAHPYTKALRASIPVLGKGRKQEIEPIRGSTPDPYNRPRGCQFMPRCDRASDACQAMPEDRPLGGSHRVRCHHPLEASRA